MNGTTQHLQNDMSILLIQEILRCSYLRETSRYGKSTLEFTDVDKACSSREFLTSQICFFSGSFLFRVCLVFFSVHCSLVVTCWERADLLDLLYWLFYCTCIIVTFPCGILGQVWCVIVLILDHCLLSYFKCFSRK